jgi:hypothetical protein
MAQDSFTSSWTSQRTTQADHEELLVEMTKQMIFLPNEMMEKREIMYLLWQHVESNSTNRHLTLRK